MPKKGGKKKKGPDFETTGWSTALPDARARAPALARTRPHTRTLTQARRDAHSHARTRAGWHADMRARAMRARSPPNATLCACCPTIIQRPAPDGLPLSYSTLRRRSMPALWVCCKRCNHHAFRYRSHRDRGETRSKAGSSGGPGRRRRWSRAHRRGRRGEGGRRKTAREWHNVGIISRRLSGALVCAFAPCALAGFWAPWFEGPCVWFCGPPLTCTPSLPPSPCLSPASLQTVAVTPEDSAGI